MKDNSNYNDSINVGDSDEEIVLHAVTDYKFSQSKCFREWLLQSEEHLSLYKEFVFYRKAALKNKPELKPDVHSEWLKFDIKMHDDVRKKHRMRLLIYSLSAAAAILIFVVFLNVGSGSQQKFAENVQINNAMPQSTNAKTANATNNITNNAQSMNMGTIGIQGTKVNTKTFNNHKVNANGKSPLTAFVPGNLMPYQTMINEQQASVEKCSLKISRGKSYHLSLDDSTEVWVNTDTKITYPQRFASDKRVVEVNGEAYFKVAKDIRPFIVKTPHMTTVDLGTEFDVRAYEGEQASVTLVEGKVSVSSEDDNKVVLSPGQNALLVGNNFVVNHVDTRNYTSWINGYFYFDNASLQEIMNELSRWYNVNITFADSELKKMRFKLWIDRNSSFEDAVSLINRIGRVDIVTKPHEAVVTHIEK